MDPKTIIFGTFSTFGPVVLPNAPPDLDDTTHPGHPPDAQHNPTGQSGLRSTVRAILNSFPFFGRGRTGFVLTLLMQNTPSWGGPEIIFFIVFNSSARCADDANMFVGRQTRFRTLRGRCKHVCWASKTIPHAARTMQTCLLGAAPPPKTAQNIVKYIKIHGNCGSRMSKVKTKPVQKSEKNSRSPQRRESAPPNPPL